MKIMEARVLVHPGYDATVQAENGLLNPINNKKVWDRLESRWRKHLAEVALNPHTFLIYLSIRSSQELEMLTPLPSYFQDDVRRIQYLQRRFSGRFLFIPFTSPYEDFPSLDDVVSSHDFSNANVYSFGEYYGICVKTFGELVRDGLGVPRDNFQRVPQLSLEPTGQIAR